MQRTAWLLRKHSIITINHTTTTLPLVLMYLEFWLHTLKRHLALWRLPLSWKLPVMEWRWGTWQKFSQDIEKVYALRISLPLSQLTDAIPAIPGLSSARGYGLRSSHGLRCASFGIKVVMNRSKDPQVSLCERKFVLEAIKENKVSRC